MDTDNLHSSSFENASNYFSTQFSNNFHGCRNMGIFFIAIDLNRPLSDQGPFDVVLHKVSGNRFF